MTAAGPSEPVTAYLRVALAEAEEAARTGNRPYGAVIVAPDGTVAMTGRNRVVERMDPSAHAEATAIRDLCRQIDALTLDGFRVYASARPCPMCFTLMIEVRIAELVFAAPGDPETWPVPMAAFAAGARHTFPVTGGVLEDEAVALLDRWRA